MGISTDSYLKSFVAVLLVSIGVLSFFILSPSPTSHESSVAMTREFGQFIEKNHALAENHDGTAAPVAQVPARPIEEIPPAVVDVKGLSADENEVLQKDFREWAVRDYVRGSAWRSQVESLMNLAEQNQSTVLLDYLKPQILHGRYDNDESNRVAAKIWAERYLRLEKREFQRSQIQDLLSE